MSDPSVSDVDPDDLEQMIQGIDDIDDLQEINYTDSERAIIPNALPQHRVAPYILNKTKQLNNLARDSSKADFEIEITHETNVNVHCSSGFYLSVARPAFSSISNEFRTIVAGISIKCTETRSEKDRHGSGVNSVFWFKVGLNGPNADFSLEPN